MTSLICWVPVFNLNTRLLYSKQSFIFISFSFRELVYLFKFFSVVVFMVVCSLLRNTPLSEYTTLYSLSCWWTFWCIEVQNISVVINIILCIIWKYTNVCISRNEIAKLKWVVQTPALGKHYEEVFQNRCNCAYLHQQWRKVPISFIFANIVF